MSNSKKGFASMSPDLQRKIASMGGKAAHKKGTAHEFTSEEAKEAGRKGGKKLSQNKEHMAYLGRLAAESKRKKKEMDSKES